MAATETLVTTIPASDSDRLAVVLVTAADGTSQMELRQQSYSKSVGWFTQSTVHLEPGQVAALRNALGTPTASRSGGGRATSRLPREFSTIAPPAWQPRVVHADSA